MIYIYYERVLNDNFYINNTSFFSENIATPILNNWENFLLLGVASYIKLINEN